MPTPCIIASINTDRPYYVLFTRGKGGELDEVSSSYSSRIDQMVKDRHLVVSKRVRANNFEKAEEKAKYLLNGGITGGK